MRYPCQMVQQEMRIEKFVEKWQRRNYRETILKDAASVHPVLLDVFDKDPYLFNCENGTLNLRTREFHAHTPEDMLQCFPVWFMILMHVRSYGNAS